MLDTFLFRNALQRVQAQFPIIYLHKPALEEVPDGTILSGTVWSAINRARWIVAPQAHIGYGVTYIDLAREWIESNVKLPVRRKYEDNPVQHAPIPLLARVGKYEDCVYVDIRSTYRRIIELAGYDVEYRAGEWLGQGSAREGLEELPKLSYSAIVALSANYRKTLIKKSSSGIESVKVRNNYANVCLYSLARDLLHCIYSDVMRSGIRVYYANTDGYIVRRKDADIVFSIINGWNFQAKIKKEGKAEVFGTGTYAFNDQKPLRHIVFRRNRRTELADISFCDWLRSRFSRLQ